MIRELKLYPEYKASSQGWLGDVPQHWSVVPNRALFAEVKDRNFPDEEMLSVTITRGIVRQKSLLESSSKKDSSNLDKSAYKLVRPGDLAYNKMRAWQGAIGASSLRGIISPAYVVMRMREDDDIPSYFHYLYRTTQFAKEAERWSYGITSDMWSLRPEHFKMIYTLKPPPAEQAGIVRFLNWANERLERAIRAKRKVVALLNEQKQAIIHRAVTRGLDPSSPLRPSGIPWLGDIPKHWEVRRVASFAHKVTNGWVGPTREILRDSGVPYLQSLHVKGGEIRFKKQYFVDALWLGKREKIRLHAGDVVVVQTGDVGQVAHIPVEFDGAGCHALIIIGTNLSVIGGSYLSRVLNCWYGQISLRLIETGALLPHLNCGYVRDVQIPVPPLPEQLAIQEHLGSILEPVSAAIYHFEREIELLREYRTRLVADVVTGKLDVREAAARLPDEAAPDVVEDDTELRDETEPADEAPVV